MDKEALKQKLKKNLNKKRYEHTLRVADAAIYLAKKYGEDEEKAEIAALFHDYAKCFSDNENENYIQKYEIDLDKYEKVSKQLIHGIIAAHICENEYGIEDIDILRAVRYHTTGRYGMGNLEKIVSLADYIEAGRDFDGVNKIRVESEKSLDCGLYTALSLTIKNLLEKNEIIHQNSLDARNYLLEIINESNKEKQKEK